MHDQPHPHAGGQARLLVHLGTNPPLEKDTIVEIEDWWDHLTGGSWLDADGNPAAMIYAIRAGFAELPMDDEVVYVKAKMIDEPNSPRLGHIVHVSELEPVEE